MDVWRPSHHLHWRVSGGRKYRHGWSRSSRLLDKQYIVHRYLLCATVETVETYRIEI